VQTNTVWANSKSNLNRDEYKEITKVYVIDTADTNKLEESSHKQSIEPKNIFSGKEKKS